MTKEKRKPDLRGDVVITFRLNINNPLEKEALDILESREEERSYNGNFWTARQIITGGLRNAAGIPLVENNSNGITYQVMNQVVKETLEGELQKFLGIQKEELNTLLSTLGSFGFSQTGTPTQNDITKSKAPINYLKNLAKTREDK